MTYTLDGGDVRRAPHPSALLLLDVYVGFGMHGERSITVLAFVCVEATQFKKCDDA